MKIIIDYIKWSRQNQNNKNWTFPIEKKVEKLKKVKKKWKELKKVKIEQSWKVEKFKKVEK